MKTLEQHLADWDQEVEIDKLIEETEQTMGVEEQKPRFYLKHALRLQGLFLHDNNEITNANGRPYATLGEVSWRDGNILKAEIKLAGSVNFKIATIDIGKLK